MKQVSQLLVICSCNSSETGYALNNYSTMKKRYYWISAEKNKTTQTKSMALLPQFLSSYHIKNSGFQTEIKQTFANLGTEDDEDGKTC